MTVQVGQTWAEGRFATALVLLSLALGGCAVHKWAPGPGMNAADFEPAKARCSLMARHSGGSFAAYGDPNFVAGASLGNAIGETVRTQKDFNDCMLASGWRIADQPTAASQPTTASQEKVAQGKAIVADVKSCVSEVRAKAIYGPLLPHLVDLDTQQFTMAQLTNERSATKEEGRLLVEYRDETRPCLAQLTKGLSEIAPAAGPVIAQEESKIDDIEIQLVKQQITWGDEAQRIKEVNDAAKSQLQSIR